MDRRAFLALAACAFAARAAQAEAKLVLPAQRQTRPMFGYWEWIELCTLDGASVATTTYKRREYALAPGAHEITVRYAYDDGATQGLFGALAGDKLRERTFRKLEKPIRFDAQAGREYVLRAKVDTPAGAAPIDGSQVSYWIEDAATGEVVARDTQAQPH